MSLYEHFAPRRIARWAFAIVAARLLWLAAVIRSDWSTIDLVAGVITAGLVQGALVTLLFNVLVSASPKELAGELGALRGAANARRGGRNGSRRRSGDRTVECERNAQPQR